MSSADGTVQSYAGQPILVDASFAEDATVALARYAQSLDALRSLAIGSSDVAPRRLARAA